MPLLVKIGINLADLQVILISCSIARPNPPPAATPLIDAIVGLSDHTSSIYPCLGAVSLGARVLEKHFIDSKIKRKGPDISASMDKNELKELILGSNKIFEALGGKKSALEEEAKTMAFAFQSVVATRNILKGEKLSLNNIFLRRPGNGDFQIKDFNKIIGKKAKRNIKNNFQIRYRDI